MPKVSSRKKAICKVGDRIQSPSGLGVVRSNSHGSILPYEIEWGNGKFSYHKEEDFKLQKFVVLESVPESKKESGDQLGIDFSGEQLELSEKCSDNCSGKIFKKDWKTWNHEDKVFSETTEWRGVVARKTLRPQQVVIVWEHDGNAISYTPQDLEILEICIDRLTVTDDRLTVTDGQLTVADDQLTVTDGQLTVADDQLTVADDRLTVADDRLTILSLIEQGVGDTTRLSAKTGLGMSAIAQQLRELSEQGKIHRVDYQWKIKTSSLTNSLEELADSVKEQESPEGLPSGTTLTSTQTLKLSTDTITQLPLFTQTSESSTQTDAPTFSRLDSLAQEPQQPVLALDLIMLNRVFGLKPCDASSRGVQTMFALRTLKVLSIADYGRFLGDSEWQGIRTTIRSLYRQRNSERRTAGTDSSLLPTPTSYSDGSEGIQPAGQNKLEQTLKLLPTVTASQATGGITSKGGNKLERSLLPTPVARDGKGRTGTPGESLAEPIQEYLMGTDKMNPEVPGWMMGFPPGYAEKILMAGGATILRQDTQAFPPEPKVAEPASNFMVEQSCPNKPPSPSNECSTSTLLGKTEEELTPVDKEAIGRHYWCDAYTVAVEVLSIRNWRVEGKLVKGADTRPWFSLGIPSKYADGDSLVVPLDELVEIEEFSCPLPGSRENFEFYVTVPAGIERPSLMPTDLCYLFVASSFWNRSRAKQPSFPRCPKFPQGVKKGADSGGYIAAKEWGGRYPYSPVQYVEWLNEWNPDWAATMDYPCEPPLTGGDRSKIRHRQKQTTKLAWHFWNNYRDVSWQWIPTVQGWDTEDYVHHATSLKSLIQEMRQHYGESFRVGIGTLCSRTNNTQIQEIIEAISTVLPGIQFHLWGVKQDAAPIIKFLPQVISSDSAAWDGLVGSRCRKIWEEQYRGKISQAEYSWTIALPKYLDKLEGKLGVPVRNWGDRPNPLEQPRTHASKQTGSLYQYTKNKADKTGVIFTHPKIEGERKREEDSHWYWGFSYVEKEKGKWKDKTAYVSRPKLAAVRTALREGKHYTYILQEILGKDG